MGDVQFILGGAQGGGDAAAGEHSGPFRRRAEAAPAAGGGGGSKKAHPKKKAMARELQGLLSSTGAAEEPAVPMVPSVPMVLGQVFKAKRGAAQGTRWCVRRERRFAAHL